MGDPKILGSSSNLSHEKDVSDEHLREDLGDELEEPTGSAAKQDLGNINLMSLNDNKAGMTGLDKDKINRIIQAASKGSKFYSKQQENQTRIDGQIAGLQERLLRLNPTQLLAAQHEADLYIQSLLDNIDLTRTLVHVDMDMFYAAVEMRDNPNLRNKPMAVGGMGMLSTSNYAARKFGVRAAMPGFIGKKLCPELVIVPVNMQKYAAVSQIVREVFREYDENFAPMSLDEAYMDITEYLELHGSNPWDVVQEIRSKIEERTQLTASAGIASNTFLAKVCSDINKPNGQYVLPANHADILEFVNKLPIRKASGIGNVQEQLLKSLGVNTCVDLYHKRGEIKLLFSQLSFENYMQISQGIGGTRLEPREDRIRKSMSNETTFKETSDRNILIGLCEDLSNGLAEEMKREEIFGQAVTVKIKSHDFYTKTKVRQLTAATNEADIIYSCARQLLASLLDSAEQQPLVLRLMGVRMSDLKNKNEIKSKQSSISSFFNQIKPVSAEVQVVSRTEEKERVNDAESCLNLKENEGYECPICLEYMDGLEKLNTHIDICCSNSSHQTELLDGVDAELCKDKFKLEDKSAENKEISSDKHQHETMEHSVTVDENYQISSPDNQSLSDISIYKSDEVNVINLESENNAATTDVRQRPLEYVCPVCFSARFEEESGLNTHIDECLNKTEINHLLKEEECGKKRKLETKQREDGLKKPRLKNNKIENYFKRS